MAKPLTPAQQREADAVHRRQALGRRLGLHAEEDGGYTALRRGSREAQDQPQPRRKRSRAFQLGPEITSDPSPGSLRALFVPSVKLDTSQVVDRRGEPNTRPLAEHGATAPRQNRAAPPPGRARRPVSRRDASRSPAGTTARSIAPPAKPIAVPKKRRGPRAE